MHTKLCSIYPTIIVQISDVPITRWGCIYSSVAEPEQKLFETRSRSRIYLLNKYLLQSVWRMLGWRKTNSYLHCYRTVLSCKIWQELELDAEPKLWTKVEPEPKINYFCSATLAYTVYSFIENRCNVVRCILKSSSYCTQSTFFN